MKIKGIGINIMNNRTVSDLDALSQKLIKIVNIGFKAVEIPIEGMEVIVNGNIDYRRLSLYQELLRDYPLRVLTHAPLDLNLFCAENFETEVKLLFSSLEVSGAIGAEVMTYHAGRFIAETEFYYPHLWRIYGPKEKEALVEKEKLIMRELSSKAERYNIVIGMENLRMYKDCTDYSYAVMLPKLADQVKDIDRANVGITLDLGHLLLASALTGLNLQKEVERVAPLVVHLHVHDNFGKPSYSAEKDQYALAPRGKGDLHMPIGEGQVPFADILDILDPFYEGYILNELRERFEPQWETVLARCKEVLASKMVVGI